MGQKDIGTREWYDFVGELSDTLPGIHLGGQEATLQLLEWCELSPESRVLDVGCGAGVTACLIAERYGSRVMGIDLSEVMVAKARAKATRLGWSGRLDFQVEDVYKLSFEDNSFDVALAESVFTPLPGDKLHALCQMVRVLRPGGRVAINESTLDAATPPDILALVEEHPAMHGHFTSETLRELFEEAGLEVIHLQEAKQVEAPSPAKALGLGGLVSFMIRVYPRVLLKLLRDGRFRRASRIDDQVTKRGKPYMGYTLIVGQK
jgi:SAM-dependent methyltransferase